MTENGLELLPAAYRAEVAPRAVLPTACAAASSGSLDHVAGIGVTEIEFDKSGALEKIELLPISQG